MKLLLDQDVYKLTAKFLISIGHDVLRVSEIGLSLAPDEVLLNKAESLGRVFVTRDRDYGNLVFVKSIKIGVVYLRVLSSSLDAVHMELERVLSRYTETELKKAF